jgi:hypothetical protein
MNATTIRHACEKPALARYAAGLGVALILATLALLAPTPAQAHGVAHEGGNAIAAVAPR